MTQGPVRRPSGLALSLGGAAALVFLTHAPLGAQETSPPAAADVEVEPAEVTLEVGEGTALQVTVRDAGGGEIDVPVEKVASVGALQVSGDSVVAGQPGTHRVVVFPAQPEDRGDAIFPPRAETVVTVPWPEVDRLELNDEHDLLYVGTRTSPDVEAGYDDGTPRPDPPVEWSSSDPSVAEVDARGAVTAVAPGEVTITAELDGLTAQQEYRVETSPLAGLEITGNDEVVRTGDVVDLAAQAVNGTGGAVDVPVEWSLSYQPFDSRYDATKHRGAAAEVTDGRFVAEEPGFHTVYAVAGDHVARTTIEVSDRDVVERIQAEGQGRVDNVHTSDFWPWEGHDGRDYAITGTWGGDGWAYIWDITDPTEIVKTDSVQVDARTVNDVKVSPDGRYATMTREGASDRVNGLVILDLAEPAHPVIAAEYDEGLTGGVHNAFPTDDHVLALSAGQQYLIIDVTDIYEPEYVSAVDVDGCSIHDIWEQDGLAYAAQWGCGVVVHDIGNGEWGGSPENPELISRYSTPGGRTHAVFPYYHEDMDRLLVFAGDEIMSRPGRPLEGGLQTAPYDPETDEGGTPSNTDGYIHVLDYSDMENPEKIARYRVPEYGTHNIWVEDGVLYQGYYEGGARILDVSGELKGNLGEQGREMAAFKPNDPAGFIANAPMVWSVMPFKGRIFVSDWNSGIWSLSLEPAPPRTLTGRWKGR